MPGGDRKSGRHLPPALAFLPSTLKPHPYPPWGSQLGSDLMLQEAVTSKGTKEGGQSLLSQEAEIPQPSPVPSKVGQEVLAQLGQAGQGL